MSWVMSHIPQILSAAGCVVVGVVDCCMALNKNIAANGMLHQLYLWAKGEQAKVEAAPGSSK